jgi:FG-GAP-like repeat
MTAIHRISSFLSFPFLVSIFFVFPCSSCKTYYRNKSHADVSSSSIEKGAALAKIYCETCHLLPDPSLLNSGSWEKGVLPEMGPRLGIFNYGFERYPVANGENLEKDFYPTQPVLTSTEWQNILDYYEATSPDSLSPQKRQMAIQTGLPLFAVEKPAIYTNATTCYVKINPSDSSRSIIIGDAIRQSIYFINRNLKITDSITGIGSPVDIDYLKNQLVVSDIGTLNPNNGKHGKAVFINIRTNGDFEEDSTLTIDSLQRPVQAIETDLNKDGKPDYLTCEFGFLTGALSWFENLGNNKFQKHTLRNAPGAIKVYLQDYNHDGLPDIWALFAQGDEGIFLFTNKGNGNFDQQEVLKFPPTYGSSSFEMVDFNNDGYSDIVYTCGDNADYSQVLKPYHGVYIFINDRTNHFTQKYFFPINGCYKAIAKDFDSDGNIDIATISFFADYAHQPEESFVYLKNTGNMTFKPYSFPEANLGRWLTMDAGDIDGDGKMDIILGNFSVGATLMKNKVDWKQSPPFIILKNTGNQ